MNAEGFRWRPMSEAPRDGTIIIARRVPEDSERGYGGNQTYWGKSADMPTYGWCHFIDPNDPWEVDAWQPDEWRFLIDEVDV